VPFIGGGIVTCPPQDEGREGSVNGIGGGRAARISRETLGGKVKRIATTKESRPANHRRIEIPAEIM